MSFQDSLSGGIRVKVRVELIDTEDEFMHFVPKQHSKVILPIKYIVNNQCNHSYCTASKNG